MLRAVLVGLLVGLPVLASAADPAGLEQARRLAQNDAREAAKAYEALLKTTGRGDPALPVILYELAALNEEQLGKPGEARNLFALLIETHPDHRLAERARLRRRSLMAVAGEDDVQRRYREILEGYASQPRPESRRLMRQLLDEHPGFDGSDRARSWLAREEERAGRPETAAALHRDAVRAAGRHGGERLATALRAATRLEEAIAARQRQTGRDRAALAFLAVFALLSLAVARPWQAPRQLRLPLELVYYLPVSALMTVAGWLGAGPPVGRALLLFAAGGAGVIGLSGLATARLARDPRSRPARAGLAAGQAGLLLVATLCLWQLTVSGARLRL